MGVKGTSLVLETRYPMKIATHSETTESSMAKAVAASHDPLDARETDTEEAKAMSKGSQLQLAE